ncbi:MAG: aldo/keto reductase, partial [Eubacterium sp.]|nr:aldo/keto reductase [Candidatus Colimonas fimequi]
MNKMGFGFQRIPTLSSGDVDFDKLIPIVDRYMELGGTFYDTAYMYLDGKSEEALKKCVVERYPRDAYQIQDKFPLYTIKDPSEFDSYLQLQLGRCGLDYFDSFLLHWMNDEIYQKALNMYAFEYMR